MMSFPWLLIVMAIGNVQFLESVDLCHSSCRCNSKSIRCQIPTSVVNDISRPLAAHFSSNSVKQLQIHKTNLSFIADREFAQIGSQLKQLRLMKCQLIRLSRDSFVGLIRVTRLFLDGNLLTDLPDGVFDPLVSLTNLYMTNNRLTRVPNTRLPSTFSFLFLSTNLIKNVNLPETYKKATRLRKIQLTNNKISILAEHDLASLADGSLEILDLKQNHIVQIHSSFLSPVAHSLTSLNLDSNTELNSGTVTSALKGLSTSTKLQHLSLENIGITHLDKDTFLPLEGSRLASLTLARNKQFSGFESETFAPVGQLVRKLDLTHCNLSDDSLNFQSLTKIQTLQLSGNYFTVVPQKLPSSLQSLDLSNNKVNYLVERMFEQLKKLKSLNLADNDISRLDDIAFKDLATLENLDLCSNKLSELSIKSFIGLRQLKKLKICRQNPALNMIETYTLIHLKALEDLDLSNNCLNATLDANGRKKRSGHPKRNNGIFSALGVLKVLNLDHNYLSKLDTKALYGLHELRTLSMAHNNIEMLPSRLFEDSAGSLTTLDLSNNKISRLSLLSGESSVNNFSNLTALRDLNIGGNPLDCSCSALQPWLPFVVLHFKKTSKIQRKSQQSTNINLINLVKTNEIDCAVPISPTASVQRLTQLPLRYKNECPNFSSAAKPSRFVPTATPSSVVPRLTPPVGRSLHKGQLNRSCPDASESYWSLKTNVELNIYRGLSLLLSLALLFYCLFHPKNNLLR